MYYNVLTSIYLDQHIPNLGYFGAVFRCGLNQGTFLILKKGTGEGVFFGLD